MANHNKVLTFSGQMLSASNLSLASISCLQSYAVSRRKCTSPEITSVVPNLAYAELSSPNVGVLPVS